MSTNYVYCEYDDMIFRAEAEASPEFTEMADEGQWIPIPANLFAKVDSFGSIVPQAQAKAIAGIDWPQE